MNQKMKRDTKRARPMETSQTEGVSLLKRAAASTFPPEDGCWSWPPAHAASRLPRS